MHNALLIGLLCLTFSLKIVTGINPKKFCSTLFAGWFRRIETEAKFIGACLNNLYKQSMEAAVGFRYGQSYLHLKSNQVVYGLTMPAMNIACFRV